MHTVGWAPLPQQPLQVSVPRAEDRLREGAAAARLQTQQRITARLVATGAEMRMPTAHEAVGGGGEREALGMVEEDDLMAGLSGVVFDIPRDLDRVHIVSPKLGKLEGLLV